MSATLAYRDHSRFVRAGVLGFVIGLGLASMTAAALEGRVDAGTYRTTMAVVYAAAGVFAGALLGLALHTRGSTVISALACALGLGGGYYLSQYVIERVDPDALAPLLGAEIGPLALSFVQFAFIGLLTGLLLGLAEGRAGQVIRGALAGVLAFSLAYLIQAAAFSPLLTLLFQPLFDFISGGAAGTVLPLVVTWGVAGALGGGVAGALLGEALA